MMRFGKWLFGGIMVLLVLALLGVGIIYLLLRQTLPEDNATKQLAGLGADVEVVFDAHAIPHIKAASYDDAIRTLGYIHARDRLWQMEFLRRVGQGRLSEVLGETTADTDVFLRTLDMASGAEASFDKLLPETQKSLIAYAEGVNAYINRELDLFEPVSGVEYMVLGNKPEEWKPWYSVLTLKVMGLTLAKNMDNEIQRLTLASDGFSPKEIDEIVTYNPKQNPIPLPDLREIYGFGEDGKDRSEVEQTSGLIDTLKEAETDFAMLWPTGRSASNNWVVSGSRTDTGKPILANDPHLGLTVPSVFYLAHMSFMHGSETRNAIGGTIPGIPFLIAGRNDRVAWGLTTTYLDTQDVYVERLNPENSDEYLTPDGWKSFEMEEVEIKVSGAEPKKFTRRVSRHGPVLPEDYKKLKDILPDGHVAVLQWNGSSPADTTIDTLRGNSLTDNVNDFVAGVERAITPMQSVVVGDVDGNIALVNPGEIPLRDQFDNPFNGRAPLPGWESKYDLLGMLPSKDVPRFINPESGALATANSNFLPNGYPVHMTYDWAEPYRQTRVEDLVIGTTKTHTTDLSREIMSDTISLPLLKLAELSKNSIPASAGRKGDIVKAIQEWDGRMDADKPEPIIMMAWFRHLHDAIFADDLGNRYEGFGRARITRVLGVLSEGTSRDWCDNIDTAETETCSQIMQSALDAAIEELDGLQGADWVKWEYGKEHTALHSHRPFGQVEPLAQFFNIEFPFAGGPYTLHRAQIDFREKDGPYKARWGGAYRAVYDFSDLNKSIFIQGTGQSGHVMSSNYRDFAAKWQNSEFVPMSTDPGDYNQGAIGTWKFRP